MFFNSEIPSLNIDKGIDSARCVLYPENVFEQLPEDPERALWQIFCHLEFRNRNNGLSIYPPNKEPKFRDDATYRGPKVYNTSPIIFFTTNYINVRYDSTFPIFPHTPISLSLSGLQEYQERANTILERLVAFDFFQGTVRFSGTPDDVGRVVKTIIKQLETQLASARSDDEKLSAVLLCCQTLCQLQPFPYGNEETIREFCRYLFKKYGLSNFKPPICIADFISLSHAELKESVIAASWNPASDHHHWLEPEFEQLISEKMTLPPKDIWRVLIDGQCHKKGHFVFDLHHLVRNPINGALTAQPPGERGYFKRILQGFKTMLTTLGTPLTKDLIITLHDECIHGLPVMWQPAVSFIDFKNAFSTLHEAELSKLWNLLQEHEWIIKTPEPGFCLVKLPRLLGLLEISSPEELLPHKQKLFTFLSRRGQIREGLRVAERKNLLPIYKPSERCIRRIEHAMSDLLKGAEFTDKKYNDRVLRQYVKSITLVLPAYSDKTELTTRLDTLCSQYQESITQATSEDEQLTCITELVWFLEHLHPFEDGNLRTAMLILNKLLLENGLSPVIASNPNELDSCSITEAVTLIKSWQAAYQRVIADEPTPGPRP